MHRIEIWKRTLYMLCRYLFVTRSKIIAWDCRLSDNLCLIMIVIMMIIFKINLANTDHHALPFIGSTPTQCYEIWLFLEFHRVCREASCQGAANYIYRYKSSTKSMVWMLQYVSVLGTYIHNWWLFLGDSNFIMMVISKLRNCNPLLYLKIYIINYKTTTS